VRNRESFSHIGFLHRGEGKKKFFYRKIVRNTEELSHIGRRQEKSGENCEKQRKIFLHSEKARKFLPSQRLLPKPNDLAVVQMNVVIHLHSWSLIFSC